MVDLMEDISIPISIEALLRDVYQLFFFFAWFQNILRCMVLPGYGGARLPMNFTREKK